MTGGLYLLDYGAGNVRSLANSLTHLGYTFQWIQSPDDFRKASKLIFPGVGAFKSAVNHLHARGLFEPLKEYIKSGKPYFGICIGLQVLFQSSAENPGVEGLGIIPISVDCFDASDKSVPHMGWNAVDFTDPAEAAKEGICSSETSEHYYFVHSYRATYDTSNEETASWVHSTAQYGREVFVASVRRGNVFGSQFHPEKSGEAGLRIIDAWLKQDASELVSEPPRPVQPIHLKEHDCLTKRVIACMDVRANDNGDLVVTKGDQYDVREKHTLPIPPTPSTILDPSSETPLQTRSAGAVRNLGKPVALASRYYLSGADELCLLNITSFRHSPLHDQPMLAVVRAAAERVFVPLTIGGGIKDTVDPDGTKRSALEVAGEYFRAGADKVSIGSEAVYAVEKLRGNGGKGDGKSAIETIASAYGRQAVVVSIDPKRAYVDANAYHGPYKDELVYGKEDGPEEERGKAWWYQCTVSGGRETRPLSAVQLAQGAQTLGAGEILLNCIDRDGTGKGFDLELINLVKKAVSIPVVASSGAGRTEHFTEVFEKTNVEAALAAGIFHREEVKLEEVKTCMKNAGIPTRTPLSLNSR